MLRRWRNFTGAVRLLLFSNAFSPNEGDAPDLPIIPSRCLLITLDLKYFATSAGRLRAKENGRLDLLRSRILNLAQICKKPNATDRESYLLIRAAIASCARPRGIIFLGARIFTVTGNFSDFAHF